MKAIAHDGYGPPEDLRLREVDKPRIDATGVLIRVRAASVNPLDWHLMRGEPSFMRMMGGKNPVERIPGSDAAGHVEEVGGAVTQFQPGDEVFGTCRGALAEYAVAREKNLAHKPARVTWEQAAAIPVAGCTALQALRDHGRLQVGQRVLVNGAAGGVGTFAVQIARVLGAGVTGVCSTHNLDLVRSIGADRVIDYTAEDFTRGDARYDLILQLAGSQKTTELRRALTPRGSLIVVGAGTGREPGTTGMLEVIRLMVTGRLMAPFVRRRTLMFVASIRGADLTYLAHLIETQTITPVIEHSFPLAEAANAIRHLETGHARGKLIVQVA